MEQAGPEPVTGPGDPLVLNEGMRSRLDAALDALLTHKSLADRPLAEKAMAVVALAKMPVGASALRMRAGEAGRWLGCGKSWMSRRILPGMRKSGSVATKVVVEFTEEGRPEVTGLEWTLLPLQAALEEHAHPLRLSQRDLATLLRLGERVIGPGWDPVGGPLTLPGLLGARQGKGAAGERLVLLRLVLRARADGRVPLVGGAVKKGESRIAVTVARLVGCPVDEAAQVVESLEAQGLLEVREASGGSARCRLVVLERWLPRTGGRVSRRWRSCLPPGRSSPARRSSRCAGGARTPWGGVGGVPAGGRRLGAGGLRRVRRRVLRGRWWCTQGP
ncbi:hypothetical protein GCM10020000_87500 [Streptomyces olivoverticillatus]